MAVNAREREGFPMPVAGVGRRRRRGTLRCGLAAMIALVAADCHGDAQPSASGRGAAAQSAATPADTAPVDLSRIHAALPPAAADSITTRTRAQYTPPRLDFPPAPAALMAAVEREQASSRFCYEEFGQKADPTLRGGVAVLVTVADNAVQDARVASSRWSARGPGDEVDRCLDERAKLAWKLGDAAVRPGTYVVQLSFRSE